jgi:tight adherence protein B
MDELLAAAIFSIVFVPMLVYFTRTFGVAKQNRLALSRMAPQQFVDEEMIRRKISDPGLLDNWLVNLDIVQRLEENMWQAGIYTRPSNMIVAMVLLTGIGAVLGFSQQQSFFYAIAGAIGLGSLPWLFIRLRRRRRLKSFNKQLPYALDLMKSSLEAGHSLQRALQVLVGEFDDPLGSEFRTVLEQTRIGLPLPRALEELLHRVPEDDLRLMVVAVRVQSEVGSSLAGIMGRLSELVRSRQRLRLQIRSLTGQARMGGIVVGLMPLFVLMMFSLTDPKYTRLLIDDPTGHLIIKFALIADGLAALWIRQLLKVNY